MERTDLCCYQCCLVLNVGYFSPVLMYSSAVVFLYHCSTLAVL